jgi:hypothetical protein
MEATNDVRMVHTYFGGPRRQLEATDLLWMSSYLVPALANSISDAGEGFVDLFEIVLVSLVGLLVPHRLGYTVIQYYHSGAFEWIMGVRFPHPRVDNSDHGYAKWEGFGSHSPFNFWQCRIKSMTLGLCAAFKEALFKDLHIRELDVAYEGAEYQLCDQCFLFYIKTEEGYIVRHLGIFNMTCSKRTKLPSTGGIKTPQTFVVVLYYYKITSTDLLVLDSPETERLDDSAYSGEC